MKEIDTVVFDVGETLMNEDRSWSDWADWPGISPAVFFAALGASIALRADHRTAFRFIVPDFDFERERGAKERAGRGWTLTPDDFYPDAVACLENLRTLGYKVGVAGNQPVGVEEMLTGLGLPLDFVISSERIGVAKPSSEFFRHVARAAGREPSEIAYVGDRIDNDVIPSSHAGMSSVFIRRGPWGYIHASWPEVKSASARRGPGRANGRHLDAQR